LSIANAMEYEIKQMDVMNAFLNAQVTDDLYMEQPPGFQYGDNKMVCKLNKAVYGIKQAPNLWNGEIDQFLQANGCKPCKSDSCIYLYDCTKRGRDIIIGIFVDDIVIAYHPDDTGMWINLKTRLMNKYKVKDAGDVEYILGMKVWRDRPNRILTIHQSQYIKKVLERFNMSSAAAAPTPEAPGSKLSKSMCPSSDDEKKQMAGIPYREAVGSLLYAAIATRPDIAHAVNECARFVSNPGQAHWTAVKRIMRYLVGTAELGLQYGSVGMMNESPEFNSIGIQAYADADWAGDKDDRKSTSGVIVKMNGDTIIWSSKKQKTIALSSAEAEYMGISSAAQDVKWLKQLLGEFSFYVNAEIFTDNQAAQAIGRNDTYHERTKHIDIRHHFIRNDVKNGEYELKWIPTKYQLADIFTKAVSQVQFHFLRVCITINYWSESSL
jgi:hypothetical protein